MGYRRHSYSSQPCDGPQEILLLTLGICSQAKFLHHVRPSADSCGTIQSPLTSNFLVLLVDNVFDVPTHFLNLIRHENATNASTDVQDSQAAVLRIHPCRILPDIVARSARLGVIDLAARGDCVEIWRHIRKNSEVL